MAQTMRENPDSRWQNSEFLKFVNQVSTGEAELNEVENTVIHHTRDSSHEEKREGMTSRKMANVLDGQNPTMERAWNEATSKINQDEMEELWAQAMEEAQTQEDPYECDQTTRHQASYTFEEENPFYGTNSNTFEMVRHTIFHDSFLDTRCLDVMLEHLYMHGSICIRYMQHFIYIYISQGRAFFKEGNLKDAILAFEAAVQESPDNSEAWRLLGESHAENDEDKKAIVCLNR
jgi:peroxin-5